MSVQKTPHLAAPHHGLLAPEHALDEALTALRTNADFWQEPLDSAIARLLTTALAALPLERAQLWRSEGGQLRVYGQYRANPAEAPSPQTDALIMPEPIYLSTLAQLRTFVTGNPANPFDTVQPAAPNHANVLHLPILADGTLWGVLITIRSLPEPYPEIDLYRATAIANLLMQRMMAERPLRELSEQAARQQAILDYAGLAIVALDMDGLITLFNPAAERLLGYRAEEVIGRDSRLFHIADDIKAYQQELRQQNLSPGSKGVVDKALSEGTQQREWTYVRKDGSLIPVMTAITVLQNHRHEPFGLLSIVTDLSERKRLEALEQREQSLISHISRGASATIGEQFFNQFIQELRRATDAHFANVFILRRDLDGVKGELLSKPTGNIQVLGIIDLKNTILEAVLREGHSLHLRNALQECPDATDVRINMLGEVIAEPLLSSGGDVLGALVIGHRGRLAEPELALHLIDIFAVRASVELERLQNERTLRLREAEQQWLFTACEQIHAQQDVDSVARIAAEAGARHSSGPRVTVALCEAETYRVAAYAGPAALAPIQTVFPRRLGIYNKTLTDKNPILLFPDFQATTAGSFLADEIVSRGIHSVALVVLMDENHDIGTITFDYDGPAALEKLNLDALATFGRSVALALGRALNRQALEYQAEHDPLTGLHNRTVLHREFARWRADGGHTTALLLLDLDRFKEVNDALGHHVGDALLCQMGDRLRTGLNYRKATLVRLGGDEFAVLLAGQSIGEARARILANNLLRALQRPFLVAGIHLEIGASIGVALYPEHGEDSHALLRSADVAMYTAKQRGGGIELYDQKQDFNTPERLALISEFNNGLRAHELVLFYQPKIDLLKRQVVGFEALMRWQHPRLGLLAPDRFLPLVEMTDAIHALTRTVLDIACAQLKHWIAAEQPWTVAVNLSARNLIDDRIVRYVAGLLERHQIPAGRLELEITETALIQDPDRALELLKQISALGVTLSIDDFGTGYSSLAYLRNMPISALKIDRAFIRDLLTNSQDQLIARSIIQLAQSLELKVIAEGVETAEVLTRLQAMGCDQVQGYYFSRPLPWSELQLWLTQWRDGTLRFGHDLDDMERAAQ